MHVQFVRQWTGPGIFYREGLEVDLPRDEAVARIREGYAVPVRAEEVERQVAPAPSERAVVAEPKRAKRAVKRGRRK